MAHEDRAEGAALSRYSSLRYNQSANVSKATIYSNPTRNPATGAREEGFLSPGLELTWDIRQAKLNTGNDSGCLQ
jgi:hypothetical protein